MKKGPAGFLLPVVAVFLVYAGVFIAKTSFVAEGTRYFSLLDDQMISMRYARNLADGHGLVWNPGGERVEGFTNPLWVLYMSMFHFLPIPAAKVSLCLQISGAIFLASVAFIAGAIVWTLTRGARTAALAAALLTAFYYPLDNWVLQGSEVSILAVILLLCVRWALPGLSGKRISPLLYPFAAIGIFVRMDFVVFVLAIFSFLAFVDSKNRLRRIFEGVSVASAALVVLVALRLVYYGEWLPNTYYDKLAGITILERGFWGLKSTAGFWSFLLVPTVIIIGGFSVGRRSKQQLFLLWLILAQVFYNIYVGGDAWFENRYLSLAVPVLFVLTALCLNELAVGAARLRGSWGSLRKYVIIPGMLASLFNVNAAGDSNALARWLLLVPSPFVVDNHRAILVSLTVDRICLPNARVALTHAGIIPYFSDRQMIDVLGKNDKYIARLGMRKGHGFWAGHLKWDYSYSIGELKPDVVLALWMEMSEAIPFLRKDYVFAEVEGLWIFLRRDSPRIRWETIPRNSIYDPMFFFKLMSVRGKG